MIEGGEFFQRKRGSEFFQRRGCNFDIKDKLKYEMFNDKKSLKTFFFSVITKNSNW